MKTMPLILTAVIINVIAQLLLKAGMNRIGAFNFSFANIQPLSLQVASNPFILIGIMCYVIALVVWLLVLSRTEVSIAYPMLSIGYILNAVAAYYIFNEDLSMVKIFGILVVMSGIYLITRA